MRTANTHTYSSEGPYFGMEFIEALVILRLVGVCIRRGGHGDWKWGTAVAVQGGMFQSV